MKRWFWLVWCLTTVNVLLALAFASGEPAAETRAPIAAVDPSPPAPISVHNPANNYMSGKPWHKTGSCLHAAVQDLLRWQGLDSHAEYWRQHFGGAASLQTVVDIADQLGLKHAQTDAGDEAFLDHVTAKRLGAAIYWMVDEPGDHAIVFCGFEGDEAVLLGVNRPVTSVMPKTEFLRRWHQCGGVAFTILP